jgi:hypothetical protein
MREIQAKISPLIKNQFPSFYLDEGEDFVTFIEAYYEWLESNHQLLGLRNKTNFNVGDTVTQGTTTGTIIAIDGLDVVVRVNNFDSFRCNVQCDEYLPVTSSAGGSTFIETQRKLNPIHWARKLFTIRDVDLTLDQFIVHFKEKYLKNIEFDINTNKRLLVKNSFDLYRSKGTERSIDLFFRLVYGTSATVYYPGDDVMRLSAAQWIKPHYLEINNSPRTVGLVGKQIVGVTSGATAFVEKYIKRRSRGGFVYMLYLSNISGTFVSGELVKADTFYADLPRIKGSLSSATVIIGSKLFSVGDLVTFVSLKGAEAKGRVAAVDNKTGVVDFVFNDGGYGYTISGPSADFSEAELAGRTQTLMSSKVLTLSNVQTSNIVSGFSITNGGSGYSNSDTITVASAYINATATINTDASGVITDIHVSNTGSGFFTSSPAVTITTSGGTSASIAATTKSHPTYFKYFEPFTQRLAQVSVNAVSSTANVELFEAGQGVTFKQGATVKGYGTILVANNNADDDSSILTISVSNNALFGTGTTNTVTVTSLTTVNGNIEAITNTSATATVMGVPSTANLQVSAITSSSDFIIPAEVYQLDEQGVECANATIHVTSIKGFSGRIDVENMKGVFRDGRTIKVRGTSAEATVDDVTLTVGLYQISNSYTNSYSSQIFSSLTGTLANVEVVSGGSSASFRVGDLTDQEIIYLNTDLLSGNGTFTNAVSQAYLTMPLNSAEYGFPKNPGGNSASVIFDCLNFDSFTIGTISSLIEINPGIDYTIDPYVLAYQPYLSGFNLHDYVFEVSGPTGTFLAGERLLQEDNYLAKTTIEVGDETGLEVGEKVIQGSANGIVDTIQASANTILVKNVQGTFAVNATPLTSGSNGSFSTSVLSVDVDSSIVYTAKGIIKSANATHLHVKRIQFDNQFGIGNTVTGQVSGATATIVDIIPELDTLQIGFNANIEANVVTANGYVTQLDIVDSGLGYRNGEELTFVSADGLRTGAVIANVSGMGTGSGYYKTTKGFTSNVSKVHDGDYYQEYSYEVLSRIPLDKYAEMFKKVMHTAGTRFFGGVLLEDEHSVAMSYANSLITYEQTS